MASSVCRREGSRKAARLRGAGLTGSVGPRIRLFIGAGRGSGTAADASYDTSWVGMPGLDRVSACFRVYGWVSVAVALWAVGL